MNLIIEKAEKKYETPIISTAKKVHRPKAKAKRNIKQKRIFIITKIIVSNIKNLSQKQRFPFLKD